MNLKQFYFGNFIEYDKHNSSYFNISASLMTIIAYLLPGIFGMINIQLSTFATLILIVVAIFERKSEMVRFYSFQFCFLSLFFNLNLNILAIIGTFIPLVQIINVIISLIVAIIMLVCYFYSLFCATQYKGWIIPWIGKFVLDNIMKIKTK